MPRKSPILTVFLALLALSAAVAAAGERPVVSADAAELPQLKPQTQQAIDLRFPEPTSILDVYRALAKASSFNLQFDPRIKDTRVTVELAAVTARQALNSVMHMGGHFYKVLDGNTVVVADDTPQNRRDYENQVIRTFYLENIEVKDMMTIGRSLLGLKNVAASETLAALTVRDTADKVAILEKLVAMHDRPPAEVVIDVELLRLDAGALGGEGAAERGRVLRLDGGELAELKSSAAARTLTSVQLSALNGRKARLQVGDRVPIPISADGGTIQYQDVGLGLEVVSLVHSASREVTLELELELSRPSYALGRAAQPVVAARSIVASARLGDGQTYLLTGLTAAVPAVSPGGDRGGKPAAARDSERPSALRDPFAAGAAGEQVVLALTPRIVRGLEASDVGPVWVGTETRFTLRGDSSEIASEAPGPFEELPGSRDPAERDRIRERLRERLREESRSAEEGGSGV